MCFVALAEGVGMEGAAADTIDAGEDVVVALKLLGSCHGIEPWNGSGVAVAEEVRGVAVDVCPSIPGGRGLYFLIERGIEHR